jgi:hypothetical protein
MRGALPLVAGVALLADLGTGGERTDLGAHAFGFIVGVAFGAALLFADGGSRKPTARSLDIAQARSRFLASPGSLPGKRVTYMPACFGMLTPAWAARSGET